MSTRIATANFKCTDPESYPTIADNKAFDIIGWATVPGTYMQDCSTLRLPDISEAEASADGPELDETSESILAQFAILNISLFLQDGSVVTKNRND